MKKILLIALVGLFANNAMASKARLQALGQTTNTINGFSFVHDGSLLLKDNRNIFLNPAQAAGMNNSFNFEMGSTNTYAFSTVNAEGGLIYDFEGGKLGFQLGRRTDITRTMSTTPAGGASTLLPPKDSVDVIFAQGRGQSWGLGFHYGDAKNDPAGAGDQKASELVLMGGMVKDRMEFFAHLGVIATAEDTAAGSLEKFEGKSYIKAGMGYQIDNVAKVTGSVFKNGYDYTTVGGTRTEVSTLTLDVRYNRVHKPKNDLMFFYGGGLTNVSGDSTTTGTKTDLTAQQIPLFLGIEGSATSWMDLRASVTQAILLNTIKRGTETQHNPNTTTIGTGATLKFNNFSVDAVIEGQNSGDINTTTLFTNASLLYNF